MKYHAVLQHKNMYFWSFGFRLVITLSYLLSAFCYEVSNIETQIAISVTQVLKYLEFWQALFLKQ